MNFSFCPPPSLPLRLSQNGPAAWKLPTKASTAPKIVRVRKNKHLYTASDGQMESVGGMRGESARESNKPGEREVKKKVI